MKVAYFDCFSGISGDMFIAALLDAGLEFNALQDGLKTLGLADVELKSTKVTRKNISAVKFDVIDNSKKVYRHLPDLNRIVDESGLQESVKEQARKVFLRIAEAEARCHGVSLEKVHFHEVGAVDTIIDVAGALVGLQQLGIQKVVASKINVGNGTVEFSHGRFPVPAPATTDLLRGVPVYATDSQAELVTPTGAALITSLAESYSTLPVMKIEAVGYGAGSRELASPNVLRVLIGQSEPGEGLSSDSITVLESNIDDMNPEIYAHLFDRLLAAGALDVFFSTISMKKNRPGIKLTVLIQPGHEKKFSDIILSETTSIGIRYRVEQRLKLYREIRVYRTSLGEAKVKVASRDNKIVHYAPEYESCRQLADSNKLPLKVVYQKLQKELAGHFE
jgi:uncharacterized protein (TIGR00299 family) protein